MCIRDRAEKERYGLDVIETPGAVPDKMLLRMDGKVVELGEADVAAVMDAFRTYTAASRAILPQPYDTVSYTHLTLPTDDLV